LVYPKQEFRFRKAILEVLKENTSPETGIGYNMLFDRVKDTVKSKMTFESYLSDLQRDGYVQKIQDPRHKKGVVIFRNSKASKFELLTIQLIQDLLELFGRTESFGRKSIKTLVYDEKKYEKLDYASMWNLEAVANCLLSSHEALIKMLPKIEELHGEIPFIRALEKDGKILLEFKRN